MGESIVGVSSATVEANLDPERRWAATTIGNRGAGRQSGAARGREGPQPDLGRGFSGFLVRVPAGAQNNTMQLDALTVGIERKKVNWVLDLDVKSFFDKVEHGWMVKFVEHRIG